MSQVRTPLALFCILLSSVTAATPIDPWKRVAFDEVANGRLNGVVVLGVSPDSRRYAYVHAEVLDGSGFLSVHAAIEELATGRTLSQFDIADQGLPSEPPVMRRRKAYQGFLDRVRADAIAVDPALLWQLKGGQLTSRDGKLGLRWRAGRPREGEGEVPPWGQAFTAVLEDVELGDHAALFELYAGSDGFTRKGTPSFDFVSTTPDGTGFIVTVTSPGSMMCWDANEYYVQTFSLAKIRVARPVRELNNAGMSAYRGGDLARAQALFRTATLIDPGAARVRYNLAAVSAKLGDDSAAIAALTELAKADLRLLRWKVATDPDFAQARQRERFRQAMQKLGVMAAE
jgi:hypothetical protein